MTRISSSQKGRFLAVICVGMLWGVSFSPIRAAAQNLNVYVSNNVDNTVSVINSTTGNLVTTIRRLNGPIGVAMTPNGRKVYVTNGGPMPGTVSVIRTSRNRIRKTITVGSDPTGAVVSPDGTHLYVTNQNAGTVSVINAATDTVTATVWVGGSPLGLAVTPDNKHAYIAVYPATVAVLDTTTNQVIASITDPSLSGPALVAITPDGKTVYVSDQISNKVTIISTATNLVTGSIPVGQIPLGLAVTVDGKLLYVANGADSTVSVIATATNTVLKTITGFDGPEGLVVTPDGKSVLVANTVSNTVSTIDIASNTITASTAVGNMPVYLGLLTSTACNSLDPDGDGDCP